MLELQSNGVTLENSLNGGSVEDAFKKSRSDAVVLEYTPEGKKVLRAKRAQGFRLKDIARFKN